jgi:hypothetical protein
MTHATKEYYFINIIPSSQILVNLMMEALFLQNIGSYKSHTA